MGPFHLPMGVLVTSCCLGISVATVFCFAAIFLLVHCIAAKQIIINGKLCQSQMNCQIAIGDPFIMGWFVKGREISLFLDLYFHYTPVMGQCQ